VTKVPGRDPEAVLRFIERFSSVLIGAGFPPMPARVFVALIVTDSGALTAAELAGLLRVSPAAVSTAVRYLVQTDLVSREREAGSRRVRYRMPDDIWDQYMRLRDQVLLRWASLLREGIGQLGADTPAGQRMAEHAEYFEFLGKEMPALLDRWHKHKAAPRRLKP
jgi:DNA-binding transcriptional regulator GbsR (MarR family)